MNAIKDVPRNNSEVRYVLYRVLNELRDQQNDHVQAWMETEGHPTNCHVCDEYKVRRRMVIRIIRTFGGRVRDQWF
jgi:hypothetical protein